MNAFIASVKPFLHPRVVTMLFYGFSAGIPILLIFSSLSLWLREAGVERSAVTYFSWAALGYSFKFVWAPLVDRLPLPYLTLTLGRRRAWLLLSQLAVVASIVIMACVDPASSEHALTWMAIGAVMLGFSSATQDIVIDAYRIESAGPSLQAMMSSTYIAGYRIGMLVAGAGALYLASYLGTSMEHYSYTAWKWTYVGMAMTMLVGIVTTIYIEEPIAHKERASDLSVKSMGRFMLMFFVCVAAFILTFTLLKETSSSLKEQLTALLHNKYLASFIVECIRLTVSAVCAYTAALFLMWIRAVEKTVFQQTYIEPIQDFFTRFQVKGALYLLLLIALYRISDIVLGVISNVFYQDLGFSKNEIATVVKSFGLGMTIAGGFLGGILSVRFGVMRILLLGAILSASTNILFMLLASMGDVTWMLITVISADNLSAGLASAAFIAFLSALTNIRFTAMQYAIFSSIMTLFPKIIGGYSGSMVDGIGYATFFMITALMGLPVIVLIVRAQKHVHLKMPEGINNES